MISKENLTLAKDDDSNEDNDAANDFHMKVGDGVFLHTALLVSSTYSTVSLDNFIILCHSFN